MMRISFFFSVLCLFLANGCLAGMEKVKKISTTKSKEESCLRKSKKRKSFSFDKKTEGFSKFICSSRKTDPPPSPLSPLA